MRRENPTSPLQDALILVIVIPSMSITICELYCNHLQYVVHAVSIMHVYKTMCLNQTHHSVTHHVDHGHTSLTTSSISMLAPRLSNVAATST